MPIIILIFYLSYTLKFMSSDGIEAKEQDITPPIFHWTLMV